MTRAAEFLARLATGTTSWDAVIAEAQRIGRSGSPGEVADWNLTLRDTTERNALSADRLRALADALHAAETPGDPTLRRPAPAAAGMFGPVVLNGLFQLETRLGGGGMGEVWSARNLYYESLNDPNSQFAIKILNEKARSIPNASMLMQREGSRTQRLSHRNIVQVFDVQRDEATGDAFIVMELLEGQPFEQLMRRNPRGLPWDEAQPLIAQVCEGLAYAHGEKLVHSDIKPSNLFLTSAGVVKILDFGIASPLRGQSSQTGETLFDPRNMGALTPRYASLEAWIGQKPDPRDDIYGLACVIYEMLSGRHPYEGMDAPSAFARKMQPAAIDGISSARNTALRNALTLSKDTRTASVEEFTQQLLGADPTRRRERSARAPASMPRRGDAAGGARSRAVAIWTGVGLALVAGLGVALVARSPVRGNANVVTLPPTASAPSASTPVAQAAVPSAVAVEPAPVAAAPSPRVAAAVIPAPTRDEPTRESTIVTRTCEGEPASNALLQRRVDEALELQSTLALGASEETMEQMRVRLGEIRACLVELAGLGYSNRETRSFLRELETLLASPPAASASAPGLSDRVGE